MGLSPLILSTAYTLHEPATAATSLAPALAYDYRIVALSSVYGLIATLIIDLGTTAITRRLITLQQCCSKGIKAEETP